MSEPTDNPVAPADEQPADTPREFGDGLSGTLERDLRRDVEARMMSLLDPPGDNPAPDPQPADVSEEERDVLAESERRHREQIDALQWQNDLLQLAREKPREAAIIEQITRAQSLSEMVEALAVASGDSELQVADVDRNNPPSTPMSAVDTADMIRLPGGRLITREEGLTMLRQADSLHG